MQETKIHDGCLRWLWLSLAVIIVDQITKILAIHSLLLHQPKAILPVLNLMLAFNKGAAFSFLNNIGNLASIIFGVLAVIVSVFILIWLVRLPKSKHLLACALSLILGGALSNLIDRILRGHVVDFIQLHIKNYYWPSFNIADTAISIGVILFLIDAFWLNQKQKHIHKGNP